MKILLTSCSFLAGCLFYSAGQGQTRFQTLPQAAQASPSIKITPGMDIAPEVESSPRARLLFPNPLKHDQDLHSDSQPDSGLFREQHGVNHHNSEKQVYNGHLLVQKVPDTYNGHLLIKTPDNKKRHLKVVPPVDDPSKKPGFRKD